ncbi:MAG: hypothetical protein ACD_28C00317G0021 [uncultured bacterium]|nr:MAG: hypothetical protein ACD_28C00317G0021 [uncultured bacterium]KKT77115.1 MAG: Nicotinate-nucleotide diphosphorylase [Candidatus Peregrinibacteria bacterium GW2011_GWA2_44_7]
MSDSFFPYDRSALLTLDQPFYRKDLECFLWGAFQSDASRGDLSTDLLLRWDRPMTAFVESREDGLFSGLSEIRWFLERLINSGFSDLAPAFHFQDAQPFYSGDVLLEIRAKASHLLKLERTLLNFLQRMCGIATLTRRYVDLATPLPVAATRKTLYGLLDKKAVSVGGGLTHRLHLGDAPLIKDNHLALVRGDWSALISGIQDKTDSFPFLTLEVRDEKEVEILLNSPLAHLQCPVFILCDNFTPLQLRKLLGRVGSKPPTFYFEVSGGIELHTLQNYLIPGVDVISIGALTHSVSAIDLSFKLV